MHDLWPDWISARRRKQLATKAQEDSWGGAAQCSAVPVPIAWNTCRHQDGWFTAEFCVPCCGRPHLLWGFTSPGSYDPLSVLSLTALQLAFDGSLWDVSRNPSNKRTRKYFRGQGRRFFFFFWFSLWKVKTPTACVSWLDRLRRDKQLPRFTTNTETHSSISSFTPHIWTFLWHAKNVFHKFFQQKLQINVDNCFSFLFSYSLLFNGACFGTRMSWDVW